MGIVTTWDNRDKTTVRMEFESEWTWQDLESAIEATDSYISSVTHQVDVIVDIEGANLPKDFMSAAKNLLANPQPVPMKAYVWWWGQVALSNRLTALFKRCLGRRSKGARSCLRPICLRHAVC